MQVLANLSFLTLSSTSDLSSPNSFVGSFRISASTLARGPRLFLSHLLRSDAWAAAACGYLLPFGQEAAHARAGCRLLRAPWLPSWQSASGRKARSPPWSPPLWRKGVCLHLRFFTEYAGIELYLMLLSVCRFRLKWADRLKHGWMQGQHNHVRLVFLRNLAKLLSLVAEESLPFPVSPCPSLNLKAQKLEGNTKHLGSRFSAMVFSYAL